MLRRVHAAVRRAWVALGVVPAAILVVACAATMVMYCANDNFDDNPSALRGDGRYRPVLARGDGHMHFLITRSIVFDRDLDFDNDLARFGDPWNQPRTVTGRKNVMQQIGPSVIWAPLLAAAHGVALTANVFGADIETHGYTMFHQRILFASSVAFAWLAIGLGVLVARRLVGGRWGPVLAGTAVLLGTTLTYYATFMPSYAHAMDAGACAGFVGLWALTLGDMRWRRYIWLGVLLGIAMMVRIQDVGFGLALALEIVMLAWQRRRDGAKVIALLFARGAVVLAIAIVIFVPQLYVWNMYYGAWLTTPQGPGQMRYAHPMVLEFLFSSRNGWLSTHPIAYLGMIGLVVGGIAGPRLGKDVRLVCVAMLIAIVVQIYINAVTYEWWSAASFGQRRMASVSLPIVIGLAVLLRAMHRKFGARLGVRWELAIAGVILGFFVAWNLNWVFRLTSGRTAGRNPGPMCCSDVPAPLSWIGGPVYAVVGNPFAFPANAWFAIDHGVSLQRWDSAVGNYALVPGVLGYEDGSYRRVTASWNIAGPGGAPYLVSGFGPSQKDGAHTFRWTTSDRAEVLLPLLMPEPHRITIPIAANAGAGETIDVTISVNGEVAARAAIGAAWTTMVLDTDGRVGETSLVIEASVRPYRGGPPAMKQPAPVGVAVEAFRVALPP
jgi:hypothetical protein